MSDNTPAEIVNPVPQIELEAKLSLQDITDIVVSENEEVLLLQREEAETSLAAAKKEHADAEQSLRKAAEGVVKAMQADESSKALASALNTFYGVEDRFVAKVDDESIRLNVEKETVSADMEIEDKKDSWRHNSTAHEKEVTQDFTDEMKTIVKTIAEKAEVVAKAQSALQEVKRKLTDLPRLQRRAKAEITKAQLRGELTDGSKILETVLGAEPKALPAYNGR